MGAKISTACVTVMEQGEALILDKVSGRYFGLNRSGATIWESLRSGLTLDEIVEHYRWSFGLTIETAERDVVGLIHELTIKQLIAVD